MAYRKRGSFDGTCSKCAVSLTEENWTGGRRSRSDYRCSPCCLTYVQGYRARNPQQYLWSAAKMRAATNGLPFNITPADITIPDVCPVFGITLAQSAGVRSGGSPSLDRVDTTKGYVRGNIEVISWRANNLKSDATTTELRLLADYYAT